MGNLFDEFDEFKKDLIPSKSKQVLSKKQKEFFKHTANIESLKEKIKKTEIKLNDLESIFKQEIDPEIINIAKAEFEIAKAIADSIRMHQFTQVQLDKTKFVIMVLCDQAFCVINPSDEDIAFYNKWAPIDYETSQKELIQDSKDSMEEMMQEELGIDIDLSDLEDDAESFARFQKMIEEKLFEKEAKKSNRKKTKKQIEAEAKRKAIDEIKNKSLRSIYVGLAKVLHPDLEENEALKAEKEELMKTITSAYEAKDLPTLLKLEMQWVYKEAENIEQLTDEKLDIFIDLLKDQVKELKAELDMLVMNPQYHRVAMFAETTISFALEEIMYEKQKILNSIAELKELKEVCPKPQGKKKIVQFVNEIHVEVTFDSEEDDDDYEFFEEEIDLSSRKKDLEKEILDIFKKMKKNGK